MSTLIQQTVFQNRFSTDKTTLQSCSTYLNSYLGNPTGTAEINNLITCTYDMKHARGIGNLITDQTKFSTKNSLLDQIISSDAFCNGTKINEMFKYLYGVYLEGCIAIVTAEQLKFHNTSNVDFLECQSFTTQIWDHINSIYKNCTKTSCTVLKSVIETTIKDEGNITSAGTELSIAFPWFKFAILSLTDASSKGTEVSCDFVSSFDVVTSVGKTYFVIWSAEAVEHCVLDTAAISNNNYQLYMFEINKSYIRTDEYFNDLNLEIMVLPGLENNYVMGYVAFVTSSAAPKCTN